MSGPPGKPTSMADVIKRAINNALLDVHTAMPGKVVKYDAAKQQADIQPLLQSAYLNEDDTRIAESFPTIPGVPVHFAGGGGAYLTFPIKEGDTGILFFSEGSLDKWLAKGGEVDPGFDHRFELCDGIFVPGLRPFSAPLKNAPTDRMTIGYNEGLRIHIDGNTIRIGSDVGGELDDATCATPTHKWMSDIYTLLTTATMPSTGATAGPYPGLAVPVVPTIASTTVRVKK